MPSKSLFCRLSSFYYHASPTLRPHLWAGLGHNSLQSSPLEPTNRISRSNRISLRPVKAESLCGVVCNMARMGGDKCIKEYGACDEFGKCGDDVIVDSGFKPSGRGNVRRNFFRNLRRNVGVPFLPHRLRPLAPRDGNLPVIGHNDCFQVSAGQCSRVLHTGNSVISERCFRESGEEVVNPEQFANYKAISTIKDDKTCKNESKYEQTRCDRENIMPGVSNNDCRRIGKPLFTVNFFGGRTPPCNNDRAHGMSKSGVSRCHAPTAGFCSSYLVGVKHRDVIADAQNHHTRGSDMGLSLGTISRVVETYSNSPAPGKYKKMNYSDARLSSPTSMKASDAFIEDVTMSADLTQFSLVPPSNVFNGLSSESPFNAVLEGVQDYVFQGTLEEPPFGENIDEQLSSIKGNQRHCKIIEEISSNLAAFYYPPDTRVLQSIKASDIECVKELGSGTYGTVYHGKWKGADVAIKKLNASCLSEGAVTEKRLVADFWKEAYLLDQLHHPNVVTLYGVVTDGPITNLATVTEYMVNGSLKQFLHRKDRTIDRRKRLIMAMDAAFRMEYLHDRNIVHFDLKSHNFLVNMKDPQRPICKIGDLGLSKVKQRTLISGGVLGTIPWMAPELLDSDNLVTEKVDVYSFGIVMWELLTGEEPYANLRSEQIIAGIIKGSLRPEVPNWCDPFWRSLMERCWSSDPDSRPSFSDIAKELQSMSAAMNIK